MALYLHHFISRQKYFIVVAAIIFSLLCSVQVQTYAQNVPDAKLIQMAHRFYTEKEYSKAAPIFKEYHEKTGSHVYFNLYFNCLTQLKEYKIAEKEIRKKLKSRKNPVYYVMWGFLYSQQGDYPKSEEKYNTAIKLLSPVKQEVVNLANAFNSKKEYDYSIKTYEKGKILLPGELFHLEFAHVHYLTRNYSGMLDEYLEMLNMVPESLSRVQSKLASAFYYDIDDNLKNEVRAKVLEYIQRYPNNTIYNKLIIWFFTRDKQFGKALIQSIALDRRTNNESVNIFNLASLATNNKAYDDAGKAYDYLIGKGEKKQFYKLSILKKVQLLYSKFLDEYPNNSISVNLLEEKFGSSLEKYGLNRSTISIVPDYAGFLAYYAHKPNDAIQLLKNSLNISGLHQNLILELKYILAQCYVCTNDLWGAILQCAQVNEKARNNPLADDANLLKAKLGFYMGNFSWALAQLNILKASTSKLIANDAMDLSLFIKEFSPVDSTDNALNIFARAEMQHFCNKPEDAIITLDSIALLNPYHPIQEEVLFKKSQLFTDLNQYENAKTALEDIIENHMGRRVDDALYELAELYAQELGNIVKAEELYKEILLNHKESIYLEKAREEYRKLEKLKMEN